MKPTEMTLSEFLAWNGKGGAKGLEEYKKLLTKKHWLTGRWAGQQAKAFDAMDSMSVFSEDEHDDPQYIRYKREHDDAVEKVIRYQEQMADVDDLLNKYRKEI